MAIGLRRFLRDRSAVLCAVLLTVVVGQVGCQSVERVGDDFESHPIEGHVFLVRGLMDVFSLGLNEVSDDLVAKGYDAQVISGVTRGDLAKKIADAYDQGNLSTPIVVVGHSYGADDATRLTRKLNDRDVPVDKLILLDPTTPPTVPSNVAYCINIYRSSPATDWVPALRGIPVKADSESTTLINFDVNDAENPAYRKMSINHFSIEADDDIQALVINEVEAAFGRAQAFVPRQSEESEVAHDEAESVEESASHGKPMDSDSAEGDSAQRG